MLGYVKITNHQKSIQNCFSLIINHGMLKLSPLNSSTSPLQFEIPISEITNLKIHSTVGIEQISFDYLQSNYCFFENGYGEMNYLKEKLFHQEIPI